MTIDLKVTEIFGPTLQGEGAAAGRHCLFVRLTDCNLECTWCDTAYTWAYTDLKAAKTRSGKRYERTANTMMMSVDEVVRNLKEFWPIEGKPTIIVVSGGEPLMQHAALEHLARKLDEMHCKVHIETAGTIMPPWGLMVHVDQWNVSPKLENSGNRLTKRYKPDVLKRFGEIYNAWFKFVVQNQGDFAEIDQVVEKCGIDRRKVMVMPEGTLAQDILTSAKKIASEAIARGYGFTFRSHVLLWGDERRR